MLFFLWQAESVSGQAASRGPQVVAFVQTEFPGVREGYVQLEWSEVDRAVAYEVTESQEGRAYYGAFPQAFISGLSDGDYEFSVAAYDAQQRLLGRSKQPARVHVEHWPLAQAVGLFAVGFIVFLAVLCVLVRGGLATGGAEHVKHDTASEPAS